MNTKTAAAEVGTILYSSWGYDQTNVDFYEVVKATATTVTLREIKTERVADTLSMTFSARPVPGKYIGEPFRRKAATWSQRLGRVS